MESELFLSILSSMAEGESASISENTKWSVKRRFQNGTYKLGYTPYGYDWDGKNMIINSEQAAVVKRIFADILSGKSTNAIADELNAEKVPSKKNTNWTSSTIRGILSNEKYTGDVIFQKTYTDESFNRHTNYGVVDQYMAPDHHEAIISHADFAAANALVNQRAAEKGIEKGSSKYQQRYAFSGKIICGECGDSFYPAIIDEDTYQKIQEERKRRATALGRNNKQTQMRKIQIPTRFHMGKVTALYDNPVKQAEYLYSLIESESK